MRNATSVVPTLPTPSHPPNELWNSALSNPLPVASPSSIQSNSITGNRSSDDSSLPFTHKIQTKDGDIDSSSAIFQNDPSADWMSLDLLKGEFEVAPKHFLGNLAFVDPEVEARKQEWSLESRVEEARGGIKVVFFFITSFCLLDVFLMLTSPSITFTSAMGGGGHSAPPRLYPVTGLFAIILGCLIRYYTPKRMRKVLESGRSPSRWFYAMWVLMSLAHCGTMFTFAVALAPISEDIPEIKGDNYLNPLGESSNLLDELLEKFGDEGPYPDSGIAKLSSAMKLLPIFFAFLLSAIFREIFGYFPSFNPLQLSFIVFLQLVPIAIPFLVGIQYSVSNYAAAAILSIMTLVQPMRKILRENASLKLFQRVTFVKFTLAKRVEEEFERQLSETKKHLDELRGKLQLTAKQVRIVELYKLKLEAEEGLDGFLVDIFDEVKFKEKIGNGAFGIVYAADFRGTTVAVKQIIAANLAKDTVEMFSSEIIMQATLHHPNIITFLGYCWKAPNLAIILEFAHNGDLAAYLKKRTFMSRWGDSRRHSGRLSFCRDIIRGMKYLHKRESSESVMHRDLKLENCLVTKFNIVKLTDFGGSREIATTAESMNNLTVCGTPSYVAPEVMNGNTYGMKCDVFSFAILLCCLGVHDGSPSTLYHQSFGKGKKNGELGEGMNAGLHLVSMHSKGQRLSLDAFVEWPMEMKDLVRACWDHDPARRPTFDEIGEEVNKWVAEDFGDGGAESGVESGAESGASSKYSILNN
jgi:hypothetical protein